MPASMTVSIDAREVQAALKKAPGLTVDRLQKWVNRSALRAERKAKQEVPVRQGMLQSSIHTKIGNLSASVTPEKDYAIYVHEGTGIYGKYRRPITPKNKKALAFTINGRKVFARSVKGQKANPFMQRSFDSVRPEVNRDAERTVEDIVRSM